MNDSLLIIFTRNPELGKVKTRLAAGIGDTNALKVYQFLLNHTVKITSSLNLTKEVHYSANVRDNDIWSENIYIKKQQFGNDLGLRMMHAFNEGFKKGFKKIVIIGSDMFDLQEQDLQEAFNKLDTFKTVIGPAEDGGYYLLGLTNMNEALFKNKQWGTDSVLKDTLAELCNSNYLLLKEKNDIDTYEDLKQFSTLEALIKN